MARIKKTLSMEVINQQIEEAQEAVVNEQINHIIERDKYTITTNKNANITYNYCKRRKRGWIYGKETIRME